MNDLGIRVEEKHWESRVPIAPRDLPSLPSGLTLFIQDEGERRLPYKERAFSNEEYLRAGTAGGPSVEIASDLRACRVILGTKEIKEAHVLLPSDALRSEKTLLEDFKERFPFLVVDAEVGFLALTDFLLEEEKRALLRAAQGTPLAQPLNALLAKQAALLQPGKTYMFFSHTHKGQAHNMRMLRQLIDKQCTLLDYELLREESHAGSRRTVAYGKWAGIVGTLDTLWAYGEHLLQAHGIEHPLRRLRDPACYDHEQFEYLGIAEVQEVTRAIGAEIRAHGLPRPLTIGVSGFRGEVGHGVREVLNDWGLPVRTLDADAFVASTLPPERLQQRDAIGLVLLDYQHLYRPKVGTGVSDSEIRTLIKSGRGQMLESNLDRFFPNLAVFLNCIVWNKESPRLLTNAYLKQLYDQRKDPFLPVIGDITCDPNGSVQACRETYPNHPVYMWIPESSEEPILADFDLKTAPDDFEYFDLSREGFVLMTVTNLPCELPRDASLAFSAEFCKPRPELGNRSYVSCLSRAHFERPFNECGLPQAMQDAVILYRGRFNRHNPQILLKDVALAMLETGTLDVREVLPTVD